MHSVPVYRVVKVVTKIGLIIYCYRKKKSFKKVEMKLYPVASGLAAALVVGIPTWDVIGLFRVGIKVFSDLSKLPVDAEGLPQFLGKWPLNNGTSLEIYNPDAIVKLKFEKTLGSAVMGIIVDRLGDQGVAGEIAGAILEEFEFPSLREVLHTMFS